MQQQQQQQQQQELQTLPTTARAREHPGTTAVNLDLAADIQVLPTEQPPLVKQLTAPQQSPMERRVSEYSLARALAGLEEPVRKKPRLAEGEADLWEAEFQRLEKWLQVNVPTRIAERAHACASIQQVAYTEQVEFLEQYVRGVSLPPVR
jgi:hypothetical protein